MTDVEMPFSSVAVTGGNGRLGQAVVAELARVADVTSIDITPGRPGVRSRYADLRSREGLRHALEGHEAVVHAAALLLPEDPSDRMFEINVLGTWNLLHTAREVGIRKVVLISSETASGVINITHVPQAKPEYLPIDEKHPLRPRETYGLSKQLCEVMGEGLARNGDLQIVALRPTLILTPGWEDYVERTRRTEDPDLWSYVVVWDVARAARLALSVDCGPFNAFYIQAEDTFAPEPTIDFMRRRFGDIPEIRKPEVYAANPFAAIFDGAKAAEMLGFRPQYDWRRFLEEGGRRVDGAP
ncbi:MAG: hypothetical protein CMM50_01540 [Rhodospirillaceae bacterium]|nr:hypothetical protein [Rhodospirillaceae bacterium]